MTTANYYRRVEAKEADDGSWYWRIENIHGEISTRPLPEEQLWEDQVEFYDAFSSIVERLGERFAFGQVSLDPPAWQASENPHLTLAYTWHVTDGGGNSGPCLFDSGDQDAALDPPERPDSLFKAATWAEALDIVEAGARAVAARLDTYGKGDVLTCHVQRADGSGNDSRRITL